MPRELAAIPYLGDLDQFLIYFCLGLERPEYLVNVSCHGLPGKARLYGLPVGKALDWILHSLSDLFTQHDVERLRIPANNHLTGAGAGGAHAALPG